MRNAVACVTDELSRDVLHNRILRTTLHRLASSAEVDPSLRHNLRTLKKQLHSVSFVALRTEHFSSGTASQEQWILPISFACL